MRGEGYIINPSYRITQRYYEHNPIYILAARPGCVGVDVGTIPTIGGVYMKQLTNAVSFKSVPTMFEIEESGLKPNTIRMVTADEYAWLKAERPAEIYIENTENGRVFVRTITHVLKFGEWLGQVQILISWKNELVNNVCPMQ